MDPNDSNPENIFFYRSLISKVRDGVIQDNGSLDV